MLYTITILTATIVAALYPLCFWISARNPLKEGFHKFHMGLPLTLSGVLNAYFIYAQLAGEIIVCALVWFIVFFVIACFYWNKDYPNHIVLAIPVVLGSITYTTLQHHLLGLNVENIIIAFLGGLIFCTTLFAMNLGHWYLNVHGLPVEHLIRSTKILGTLLLLRFSWDIVLVTQTNILHQDILIRLYQFIGTLDGFLILVGIFFGTIFPFISLYFVLGTLKLKNTQSATGILYVTLCSVLLGDMAYKYYLIKFSIAL